MSLDAKLGPVFQPALAGFETWEALTDNGLNNAVDALAVIGTDLFVGGTFTAAFSALLVPLNRIARYDTTDGTWNSLAENGLNGNEVMALAVSGSDLLVGGDFTASSSGATTGLNFIAKYDTTGESWSALADGGLNDPVFALAFMGTDLFVGGQFTASSGTQPQA